MKKERAQETVQKRFARHLYYTAWLLAEAGCNIGGLGYSGLDKHGHHTWHGASNVDIVGVEFGTSLRVILDSWNSKTVIWLRYAAYERLPSKYQVAGTYTLSSMWHGFYPGYYCTFFTANLMTLASRAARRSVRPLVVLLQGGEEGWVMTSYHVVTWFMGRLILSYCVFSFVLLRFWPSVNVYWDLMFYMHIIALLCIYVLPVVLPPPKRSKASAGDPSINGVASDSNGHAFRADREPSNNTATTERVEDATMRVTPKAFDKQV
ncbi:lysophospholipid acyltransferase 6-like [Hyalella azteca]|uniref:Lysophospholipid acyltransferase 6-like n=1 Tax=Hyalella azteca TaxID=294128 RepID=A0A8B7NG87_HYAAZ|nr:lysophospholipid acyltransferase 6-like [Hyalella azteca]